jgi:transposase
MTGKISGDTQKALALVLKGWTPYAAAKHTGIALSTIYRALKRESESALLQSKREKEKRK